ncbi:MAG: sugar ABC transporter ATP-binding protein [Treponema sp.]|jgi:inositol transport system ATP-binding protein|nr:sugar ABC transporter ATP-binding protein [Treponema sp.]
MVSVESSAIPILEAKNVSKYYPGVHALNNVNFRLFSGKVHALMGENGAGKSTLMKIIAGLRKRDAGEITLHGKIIDFDYPRQALQSGIAMIHQELSPVLDMTIQENLFLGKEYHLFGKAGPLDYWRMKREAHELLRRIGIDLDVGLLMRELSVSQMQMVEIAKALSYKSEIIIMDEPTATLTNREVDKLFEVVSQLRNEGCCIVYITHKMDEVFRIADEITVFRDGMYIGTYNVSETNQDELIRLMVDRDITEMYPVRDSKPGVVCLSVKGLYQDGVFGNISFQLHRGEILGFSGLVGAGRTELVNALFGITKPTAGEIIINNKWVKRPIPKKMIQCGIGYVTEDRQGNGLVMSMSVEDNVIISSLTRLSNSIGFIRRRPASAECSDYIRKLRIKTPSHATIVQNLSGGNQQKVILAKWLMRQPDIIIFDEPTRGIDVGAKSEIYHLIAELAAQGKGIIFISSEMPEILGMCDRIIVLHEGACSGIIDIGEATQEKLLAMATGIESGKSESA